MIMKYIIILFLLLIKLSFAQSYISCNFTDQDFSSFHQSLLVNCGGRESFHISSQTKIKKIKFKVVHVPIGLMNEERYKELYREQVFEVEDQNFSTLGNINPKNLSKILENETLDSHLKKQINWEKIEIYFLEVQVHPQTPYFSNPPNFIASEDDVFFEDSLIGIVSSQAEENKFVLDFRNNFELPLTANIQADQELNPSPTCAPISGEIIIQFASFTADYFDWFFEKNNNQELTPEDQIILTLSLPKKIRKTEQGSVMHILAYCVVKGREKLKNRVSQELWQELSDKYKNLSCSI